MSRVLGRTKEITRREIAVSVRLSAGLNDSRQALRCDREEVPQHRD